MQEDSLGFEKVQHNNSNHRSFLKPGQSDVTIDTSAAIWTSVILMNIKVIKYVHILGKV